MPSVQAAVWSDSDTCTRDQWWTQDVPVQTHPTEDVQFLGEDARTARSDSLQRTTLQVSLTQSQTTHRGQVSSNSA